MNSIYSRTHTYIYFYSYTYIHIYIHTHIHTDIHTHIRRRTYEAIYIYIDKTKKKKQLKITILVRVEVCVCVYIYIYIYMLDGATQLFHFPLLGVGKIRNRYVCLLAADPFSRTVSLVDRALDQIHNHNQQPHMERDTCSQKLPAS